MAYAEAGAACRRSPGSGPPSVALAVYALLGSSRQLSVGPESTTALMTAVGWCRSPAGRPAPVRDAGGRSRARWSAPSACWRGLARLGFLADLLSKPVLVGYMAGVAVIMIAGQLGKRHRRTGRR